MLTTIPTRGRTERVKAILAMPLILAAIGCSYMEGDGVIQNDNRLPPGEVIKRASTTAESIQTVRTMTQITSDQFGRSYGTSFEDIRTEHGVYSRTSLGNEIWENLYYQGHYYFRGSNERTWRVLPAVVDIFASPSNNPLTALYAFEFADVTDLRYPDGPTETTRALHLVGALFWRFQPDSRNISQVLEEAAMLHGHRLPLESLPGYSDSPDEGLGTVELWFGEDFQIDKLILSIKFLKNGEQVGYYERTSEYSDFNGPIKLPGPLPSD